VSRKHIAELGYSKQYGRIELTVPHGTRMTDLAKIKEILFGDWIQRLPRGCQSCTSGDSFTIRERLEEVILVDLEEMQILDEGRGIAEAGLGREAQ
jgi:hypothetical protein